MQGALNQDGVVRFSVFAFGDRVSAVVFQSKHQCGRSKLVAVVHHPTVDLLDWLCLYLQKHPLYVFVLNCLWVKFIASLTPRLSKILARIIIPCFYRVEREQWFSHIVLNNQLTSVSPYRIVCVSYSFSIIGAGSRN